MTGELSVTGIAAGAAAGGALKAGIKTMDRATNDVEGDALDLKQIAKDTVTGAVDGAINVATAGMLDGITAVKEGIIQGAKAGAISGAASGAASYTMEAVTEDDADFTLSGFAASTIQNAAVSGVLGGVMGGVTTKLGMNAGGDSGDNFDDLDDFDDYFDDGEELIDDVVDNKKTVNSAGDTTGVNTAADTPDVNTTGDTTDVKTTGNTPDVKNTANTSAETAASAGDTIANSADDTISGTTKLSDVEFKNGRATLKSSGENFTGTIEDTLDNGDTIKITYNDGKLSTSSREGSVNFDKDYIWHSKTGELSEADTEFWDTDDSLVGKQYTNFDTKSSESGTSDIIFVDNWNWQGDFTSSSRTTIERDANGDILSSTKRVRDANGEIISKTERQY